MKTHHKTLEIGKRIVLIYLHYLQQIQEQSTELKLAIRKNILCMNVMELQVKLLKRMSFQKHSSTKQQKKKKNYIGIINYTVIPIMIIAGEIEITHVLTPILIKPMQEL